MKSLFFIALIFIIHQSCKSDSYTIKNNKIININNNRQLKTEINLQDYGTLDLIVEFDELPLFISRQNKNYSRSKQSYETIFNDFEKNINNLKEQSRRSCTGSITDRYYKLFFGVGLTVSKDLLYEITNLPNVKKVYRDKKVSIKTNSGNKLIKADIIKSSYGFSGKGIKVGVIDTGIDYNHLDLGAGFGKGFKVEGGYDFYYSDTDPMDINSHGTHVAGIIAAKGDSINGVAPDAKLYAIKVLSDYGSGTITSVIKGIEYAADPNGDDDYSDRLDIVNLSLGYSEGNFDSPDAVALNNLSKLGTVCVTSAGNDGDEGIYTIGSPASALEAITVAACINKYSLTNFTSVGPAGKSYSLKPDISAPGYNILSTEPGNSYGYKNGTSMAAPFIAGSCALLLEKYPELKPEEVKSALMISSDDNYKNHYTAGNGLADLEKAINTKIVFSPPFIDFGRVDFSKIIWSNNIEIKVINISNERQNIRFVSTNNNIDTSLNNFSLMPQEQRFIKFSININTGLLDKNKALLYSEKVTVKINEEEFYLDLAYNSINTMQINFDEIPQKFSLVDKSKKFFYQEKDLRWLDDYTVETKGFDLPKKLDFYAYFPKGLLYYDKDVNLINGTTRHVISKNNSDKEIIFNKMNNEVKDSINFLYLNNDDFSFYINKPSSKLYINKKLPENMTLYFSELIRNQDKLSINDYIFSPQIKRELSDNINTEKEFNIEFFMPYQYMNEGYKYKFYNYIGCPDKTPEYSWNGWLIRSFPLLYLDLYDNKWKGQLQLNAPADFNNFPIGIKFFGLCDFESFNRSSLPQYFIGSHIYRTDTQNILKKYKNMEYDITENDTLYFGSGPYFINAFISNNNDVLNVLPHIETPFGSLREYEFNIKKNSEQPKEGFNNNFIINYKLFHEFPVNLRYKADFLLNEYQAFPELEMLSFKNEKGNILNHSLEKPETIITEFYFNEWSFKPDSDNFKVSYRLSSNETWKNIKCKFSTNYKTNIVEAEFRKEKLENNVSVDMKLIYKSENYYIEQITSPAFIIGNVEFDENDKPVVEKHQFYQNYPNPFNNYTNIKFKLAYPSAISLSVYNSNGQKLDDILSDSRLPDGYHNFKWDASKYSSGLYYYKLTSDKKEFRNKMILLK